jgi:hypothetical protein
MVTDATAASTAATSIINLLVFSSLPQAVTYKLAIKINETFDPDLRNPNSTAFRNLAMRFRLFLNALYQDKAGFLGVIIISFSPGSIVADIDIIFNSTVATPTVQEIREPIAEAIANGSTPFAIESFDVAKKSASKDNGGLETWEIVLIVCLGVVLLILVFVSILVSVYFTSLLILISVNLNGS